MPVVRLQRGDGEGEGVGGELIGRGQLDPEVARVANNLTLADHVGRFIAGQVVDQFQDENLADMLKGKNQIMISGSWG